MSQDQGSSNQVKMSPKNCTIFYLKAIFKDLKATLHATRKDESNEANIKNNLRQTNSGCVTDQLGPVTYIQSSRKSEGSTVTQEFYRQFKSNTFKQTEARNHL